VLIKLRDEHLLLGTDAANPTLDHAGFERLLNGCVKISPVSWQ
jgi:hypothetical protein